MQEKIKQSQAPEPNNQGRPSNVLDDSKARLNVGSPGKRQGLSPQDEGADDGSEYDAEYYYDEEVPN